MVPLRVVQVSGHKAVVPLRRKSHLNGVPHHVTYQSSIAIVCRTACGQGREIAFDSSDRPAAWLHLARRLQTHLSAQLLAPSSVGRCVALIGFNDPFSNQYPRTFSNKSNTVNSNAFAMTSNT